MNVLYTSPEMNINVCYDNRVLRFKSGPLPRGLTVLISVLACLAIGLLLVFGTLFLKLGVAYISGEEKCGLVLCLGVEIFFMIGVLGAGWMVMYLVDMVLPYSAEIFVDKKMAICGNILYRRKFSLAKEIMLLIKPVYTRGDWGFSLEMVSASRFRLLPGVFVGSYSKSLSQARTLGKEIQKCVGSVVIEESKWWRYH